MFQPGFLEMGMAADRFDQKTCLLQDQGQNWGFFWID